jgi:hypothetical protein
MNLLKLTTAFISSLFWSMGYGAWDGVICCQRYTGELQHCAFCYSAWSIGMTVLCFKRRKNMGDDAEARTSMDRSMNMYYV